MLSSILILGVAVPVILADDSFAAQASLIDTASATDTISTLKTFYRTVSDTVTADDIQSKAVSLSLSDTATVDDTITLSEKLGITSNADTQQDTITIVQPKT